MKVLIFGGSGFLGSHVADALMDSGHEVTIFDLCRSPHLKRNQNMIVGDILDSAKVAEVCAGQDAIYNFAGLADINDAKNRPMDTAQLNIIGNLNVLEGARLSGAKRFLFASTVYVFSEAGSFYRASKQACENFVELYQQRYGLPFTVLRYGSLYGRRADSRNAIYRFVSQALEKRNISYNGTGDELREYIHVLDAAAASVEALNKDFENQHITITGSQSFRVKDVMSMISEILGSDVKLSFADANPDSHYNITPYSYKPKLGKKWVANPFVDFGQGVLDCIHEFEESKVK